MLFEVVSIRDSKVTAYSQPMFFVTKGAAIRAFHDEAKRPDSQVHAHPEDFALFHIAVFDDNTGSIVSLVQPEQIAKAEDA